jgi:hypothetical protein
MRLLLLSCILVACGDDNLAGVGQPCASSGECAAGLLCDFSKKQHTCQPAGQVHPPDLSTPESLDMAGEDLSLADLSQVD